MGSLIDSIVLICFLYFLYRGWSKGIVQVLLGPISLIISCSAAIAYYKESHNLIAGILIGLFGPAVLNALFSISLNIWHKTVTGSESVSSPSRMIGSLISLLWGGFYLLMALVLVMILPLNAKWLDNIRGQILQSRTYTIINQRVGHLTPSGSLDMKKILSTFQSPGQFEKIQSLDEYKTLMEEEAIHQILSDKELLQNLQEKNLSALIANPKMQAILKNEKLLKKLFALNVKMVEQSVRPEQEEEVEPQSDHFPIQN